MVADTRVNNPVAPGAGKDAARLLLMRHAQTGAGVEGRFLGTRDEGVTDEGARQSARAVAGLVAWHPDRIITSPLRRCRELIAEPAAEKMGVPLTVDERIREFDFGPLEGLSFDEIVASGLPFPWGQSADAWPPQGGGERMEELVARLSDAAAEYERLEGRTAVIAHGGVIRGFFCVWFSFDAEQINRLVVGNVSSTVFRMAPGNVCLEQFGIAPEALGS